MKIKLCLFTVLCCVISDICLAQIKYGFNFNFYTDTTKLRIYGFRSKDLPKGVHAIIVPIKFNDELISNKKLLDSLNDGLTQVIGIDYVYTQYKDAKTQSDLNKKRIFELYISAPNLFNQNMTKWAFYEQLGFTKVEDARKLFHGLIIKFKRIEPYAAISPVQIKDDIQKRMQQPKDSIILNIFNRNPKLKKDLIVADLTCSMSPYYLELFSWFCLQDYSTEAAFALFNDGDGKANELKIIGNTGGVHQFSTSKIDTISKYVFETIKTGCSGDDPENDIEAILKAIQKNPSVKEVVLVADNWSDMRDFSLRGLITKPVHILLCGTQHGINLQYLNLALDTKGSVHTLTEDLNKLFDLNEGSVFSLHGYSFIVRNHKIERLSKM
jgi:hypothetical protein